ncbi:MAG: hypothetical protein ABH811_01405 [archaeon]
MAKSEKWVFLYALIITFVVFNIGIFMGYKLESSRIDKINDWYLESEMELLDQRIQGDAFDLVDLDCDSLAQSNIDFANRIFEKALIIDKYEKASRINDNIISLHKKYDLLRTLLWMNSIGIKEKCESDYHNLVYFYKYNDPSIEQKAKQRFFSNLLVQIKEEKGGEILLIPIAADNELSSIDLLLEKYQIKELPTIIIDEQFKIINVESKEDIERYLD